MRFLDPCHPGDGNPGKAFPLRIRLGSVFTPENLVGVKGEKSQIDTGCTFDGTLKPKLWQRKLREQTAVETNAAGMCSKGAPEAKLRFVHMPPGVSRMKVVSKAERKEDGGEELKFQGVPETNALPALPVQERGTVLLLHDYNNQPEQALERTAKEHKSSFSPEVLQEALSLVAARLDITWADWSGEAALRQLKEPVLLIGGGKDAICTTNDLHVLEQAAPPGSNTMVIPEADRWAIRYWFHEIAEPVKAWFREHLPAPLNGQADNRVQRRTESVRNVYFSEAPMTRSRSILEPATVGPGLRTPPK